MDYLQYDKNVLEKFEFAKVLNLIINGLPSISSFDEVKTATANLVLNLIINGLPSIL